MGPNESAASAALVSLSGGTRSFREVAIRVPICGVYLLLRRAVVVYVGQSADVEARISAHLTQREKGFDRVSCVECLEGDLDELERALIIALRPEYNCESWSPIGRTQELIAEISSNALKAIVESGASGASMRAIRHAVRVGRGKSADNGVLFRAVEKLPNVRWDPERAVYVLASYTPCTNS